MGPGERIKDGGDADDDKGIVSPEQARAEDARPVSVGDDDEDDILCSPVAEREDAPKDPERKRLVKQSERMTRP